MTIDPQVKGLIEAQRRIEKMVADLHGAPMLNAMRDAVLIVTTGAKKNLVGYSGPETGGVDSGRLRASITPTVTLDGNAIQGVVGSNVAYAPFVELDTRPHWPPLAALEVWAKRHGTTAYVVARAIAQRGTVGKKFLQRAFTDNKDRIFARIRRGLGDVTR